MERSDFMTSAQKMLWSSAVNKVKFRIPRTHENCKEILGVSRPGKTKQDKARSGK